MSERCIVRIKFTPAGSASEVRRAVGGFLRYVQHRDLHPDSKLPLPGPEVTGLLKYVAYRDQANARAELFGPRGPIGTKERKEFAGFVARSIENSEAQLFRTRDGGLLDRRRAVSRLIISPERAEGLDLGSLARAAVSGLQSDTGVEGLRWIAAIHRNTKHHHVHLVLAGMVEDGSGGFRRVDVTKPRLGAIKEAVAHEIERQRSERKPSRRMRVLPSPTIKADAPAMETRAIGRAPSQRLRLRPLARIRLASSGTYTTSGQRSIHAPSLLALRAVARRYSRQMQREAEQEVWRLGRERAA
jgi:hypothetical protein